MTAKIVPTSSAPEGQNERGAITLQQFLTLTAASPAVPLRRSIGVALSVETPRSREAYGRFYGRVIAGLGLVPGTEYDHASTPAVPAAA